MWDCVGSNYIKKTPSRLGRVKQLWGESKTPLFSSNKFKIQELTPFLICLLRGSCSSAHFLSTASTLAFGGRGRLPTLRMVSISFLCWQSFVEDIIHRWHRQMSPYNVFGISNLHVFSRKFFICLDATMLADHCNTRAGRPMGCQLMGFMRTMLFHSVSLPERRVEDRTIRVCFLEASSCDWILGSTPTPQVTRIVLDLLTDWNYISDIWWKWSFFQRQGMKKIGEVRVWTQRDLVVNLSMKWCS